MRFSFIVIAYNEEANILSTLESIMGQKGIGSSYEVIVVDDGSRDKTASLVIRYSKTNSKVRLIGDGINRGRGCARHMGVTASRGQFIAMIDGDIILPKSWLATCLKHIDNNEAVGGIPIPDGDVCFIFNKFKLQPKTVMTSTTITGNNGLYRKKIFETINFDKSLREGEDVDFNHKLISKGFSAQCIPGLTVEHQENKSLLSSMAWLYQSGIGATRQLLRFHEIRLPDLAFLFTLVAFVLAILATILTGSGWWFFMPALCIFIVGFMHTQSKFYISVNVNSFFATIADSFLILCYYAGRLIGTFKLMKN